MYSAHIFFLFYIFLQTTSPSRIRASGVKVIRSSPHKRPKVSGPMDQSFRSICFPSVFTKRIYRSSSFRLTS